jgi:hypothetical protein
MDAFGDGLVGMNVDNGFETGRLLVPEQDAEELIVDEFFDAFGDAAEEFVTSEDGSEFAADFEEEREGLMLLVRVDWRGLRAGCGTVAGRA